MSESIFPNFVPETIFFVPHQDDEVLTCGAGIIKELERTKGKVAVVLCTDGRNCTTRLRLNNGKSCAELNDAHVYEIDAETYGKLRDVEFIESCVALGVPREAVHLASMRMEDGATTVSGMRNIMESYLRVYPDIKICTHAYIEPIDKSCKVTLDEIPASLRAIEHLGKRENGGKYWGPQHADHRNCADAAIALYREGLVSDVELYVEFYHLAQFRKSYPEVRLISHALFGDYAERLRKAVSEYCVWDPENQRYALGFHSAKKELKFMESNVVGFSYRPNISDGVSDLLPLWPDEFDEREAADGYAVFFDAFIKDTPNCFIEFSNFVHKHYGNPNRLESPAVIEYVDGDPAAMQWFMGMPFLVGGEEILIAHGADFASTKKGSGFPVIRVVGKGKKLLAEQGIPFRIGAPNDRGLAVASKFGYQLIGGFHQYALDLRKKVSAPEALSVEDWTALFLQGKKACQDPVVDVLVGSSCIFDEADYALMNADEPYMKSKKSDSFYRRHIDGLIGREFVYCKALDSDGRMQAYLVAEVKKSVVRVVDWDTFCEDQHRAAVFAKLLAQCAMKTPSIHVSHVNPMLGEHELFESLGFSLKLDFEGVPVPNRLCIMPCIDDVDPFYYDFANWKLRELDRDYFLNSNPA